MNKLTKPTIKKVGKLITLALGVIIAFSTFSTVGYGVFYTQDFLANTGTVHVLMVDITYATQPEKMQAIGLCVLSMATMVLQILGFVLLWRFFNEIAKKETIFLPGQGKRLRNLAILLTIVALISAVGIVLAHAASAPEVIGIALVVPFLVAFGLGMIFPMILFCMALVFNRGMKLQIESDETL